MKKVALLVASGAVALGFSMMTAQPAMAWGCKAQGNGNAYGYSHSYSSRSEAEQRALSECRARPSSGSCVIVSCNQND